MPTAEPPTPTHEEARAIADQFIALYITRGGNPRVKLLRDYIEQAESTAAELLKARERIAELERDLLLERGVGQSVELTATNIEAQNARMRERIAELERDVAEEKRLRRIDIDAMLDAESRLLAAQKAIVPVNSTAITEQKLFTGTARKIVTTSVPFFRTGGECTPPLRSLSPSEAVTLAVTIGGPF